MSLVAMVAVFRHSRAELGARLVLLCLAEFAHDDGSNAFPSVATLASRTLMSERGVQKALRRLEELGEISKMGQTSKGVYVWRITLEGGEQSSPLGEHSDAPQSGEPRSPDPSKRHLRKSGEPENPEDRARLWLSRNPEVTSREVIDYVLEEFGVPAEAVDGLLRERRAAA